MKTIQENREIDYWNTLISIKNNAQHRERAELLLRQYNTASGKEITKKLIGYFISSCNLEEYIVLTPSHEDKQ